MNWTKNALVAILVIVVVVVVVWVVSYVVKAGKSNGKSTPMLHAGGSKRNRTTGRGSTPSCGNAPGETSYRSSAATPASSTAAMVGNGMDVEYQAANSPPGLESSGPAPPPNCPNDQAIRMPRTAKLENLLPNVLRDPKNRVRERSQGSCNSAPKEWAKLAPDKEGIRKYVKSGAQALWGVSDQVKDPTGRISSAEPWLRMPTTALSTKIHPFNESSLRADIVHDAMPKAMVDPMACKLGQRRRV